MNFLVIIPVVLTLLVIGWLAKEIAHARKFGGTVFIPFFSTLPTSLLLIVAIWLIYWLLK